MKKAMLEGVARALLVALWLAAAVLAQANSGELRLQVTDASGLAAPAAVAVVSRSNQYQQTFATTARGTLDIPHLPYGTYALSITRAGFKPAVIAVTIRTSTPTAIAVQLKPAAGSQTVTVTAPQTLINPAQPGAVAHVGQVAVETRLSSVPGRSLQDLIKSEPGWIYEGNAVLHPRGSEYDTQFVIDGVPLQDNRSPSFGPEIEADDIASMKIYTAGIPAAFGRKLGGVVEINTIDNTTPGFHGAAVVSGGSFASRSGFLNGDYTAGQNTLGFSGDGSGTDHYLNPVVPENYTNTGTTGDFSFSFERRLDANNRLDLTLRHALSRFELPNEQVQEAAGQRQNANNFETMGIAAYEHIFSAHALAAVHAMLRTHQNNFFSNPQSTPVMVFQHNAFDEAYLNGSVTLGRGPQEWQAGIESDNTFLHGNTAYQITDPTQYDPGTPLTFSFVGHKPDLEQAAYAQDLIRLGNWTIEAGMRYDHYQLILNRQALSPRLAVSRYFPRVNMTLHFSYDRMFQTPSNVNLLLSSSTAVESIAPADFLRLPVQPSVGNYYEGGFSKSLFNEFRLNFNYYRRAIDNFSDDDQLANTTVSFPINFDKAVIYGAETELQLPNWGRFSEDASWSYMVGNAWFPVTGGLFLGDDAAAAASETSGYGPDSQDQRNTVRGRIRYQVLPRLWVAGGLQYGSGLPFDFDSDYAAALAEYGQQVVDRINFSRGRILPATLFNLSLGATLHAGERYRAELQLDGDNLNNELDVIDFGGLFSGNAIGPSRSVFARLKVSF